MNKRAKLGNDKPTPASDYGSARTSTDPVIIGSAYRYGEAVRYPQNGQSPFGTLDVYNFVVRKTRAFLVQEVQEFANFFRSKR